METSFSGRTIEIGDIVSGKIVKITGHIAFLDFGGKSEGYIELSELKNESGELVHGEGDEVEAEVVETRGAIRLSHRKAVASRSREIIEQAWKKQEPVTGRIVAVNKGGYEVRVSGLRAFCPSSQIADHFVREPARMVGQELEFKITEFGGGKSLVISRRALLEEHKERLKDEVGTRFKPGTVLQGTVTQLAEYGAFVDLGGVDGLVHVSEISHEHIKHPAEKLTVGDAVEVKVLRVEAERGRVGLSIKALQSDPSSDFARTLEPGQKLTGTVARIKPFGAFVNIGPGVDGLLHVSAISIDRVENPEEVLKVGQEIEVVVDRVELDRGRIGLVSPEVAERRSAPLPEVKRGEIRKGKVVKVERFGVFVELAPRLTGLVPNAEMATDRNADHARMFPIGSEMEVKVLEVDKDRRRIRLSRKALTEGAEDADYADWRSKNKESGQSLGTFGDLFGDLLKKK